uniref:DUF4411 family protein n=1 Tax=Oscillatoriales cyanobacterium SpSt-402 TaxID=2282168 RepID=A0A832H1Q1_9CYAN
MAGNTAKYVIDTCSLIKLSEDYPPDVFGVVWDAMDQLAESGVIVSSVEVLDELRKTEDKNDIVLMWAERHERIFLPLDGFVQQKALEILAIFENLVDLNKKKSSADAFVIGTAMMYACAVVTDERPTNNTAVSGHKVRIPDVCKYYKVRYVNLVEMLRAEGVRFLTMAASQT